MKLSEAQKAMLRALERGDSFAPWGFRGAGRASSAWYRTVDVLVRRGLAIRQRNMACITEAGRVTARSL
jgi:hypothetical protein